MLIFTIILFGLACVRALYPLTEAKNYTFGRIITVVCLIWAYIWFLSQFVKVK